MIALPKAVAMASAAGAALWLGVEVAMSALQQTALPAGEAIGSGVAGGVIVGAVAWATYKAKVDQHERKIEKLDEKKADKDQLTPIHEALERIEGNVTWLVRSKQRGE